MTTLPIAAAYLHGLSIKFDTINEKCLNVTVGLFVFVPDQFHTKDFFFHKKIALVSIQRGERGILLKFA